MLKHLTFLLLAVVFCDLTLGANTARYPKGDLSFTGDIVGVLRDVHEGWLPLRLQFAVDPTFDAEQREILAGALKIFLKRGLSEDVIDCAFRKSYRDLPVSRARFETQLGSAITMIQVEGVNIPSFAFIARYWNDQSSVGLGFMNLFYDDRGGAMPEFSYRHYLHVAINSDHLGSNSSYYYKDDVEYWAGVLGHEFLHNLGYTHPNGYQGSFIAEYGHCLARNGLEAMPITGELEDTEIYKHL